jgi:bacterioferritin-associated ferredoxin
MLSEEDILARLKPGCICKGIKLYKIQEAINNGATSFEEIAKTTGIGAGSCNSKRCGAKVEELLAKTNH